MYERFKNEVFKRGDGIQNYCFPQSPKLEPIRASIFEISEDSKALMEAYQPSLQKAMRLSKIIASKTNSCEKNFNKPWLGEEVFELSSFLTASENDFAKLQEQVQKFVTEPMQDLLADIEEGQKQAHKLQCMFVKRIVALIKFREKCLLKKNKQN